MRRAVLTAALAVGLAASACSGAGTDHATRTTPPDPASTTTAGVFYRPPAPLPAAEPGTLIRDEGVVGPEGVQAWRILYHSRGPGGEDLAVSGVVVAPAGSVPAGSRKVIVYGHATTGISDACAPSSWSKPLSAIIDAGRLLDAGYVVVETDYPGLGTPGTHPLYVAASEGRAMLDAARAARALPTVGAGAQTVILGYSQGGQAALAAAALTASYAPDLHVHGVVAAAPLVYLPETLRSLNLASGPGYTLLATLGQAAADPEADADAVLTPAGRRLARYATTACTDDVLTHAESLGYQAIFRSDPITTSPLREDFAAQAAVVERPGMPPIDVVQGTADVTIPPAITDAAVARLCALRNTVSYRTYAGRDHASVISASVADIMPWIADRFAGLPAPDTCRPS
jgi:predicted esterase